MSSQIVALANLPARGARKQFRVLRFLLHSGEHRTSGAGHPGIQSSSAEPIDGFGDRGTEPLGNRLQVVVAEIENFLAEAQEVLICVLFAYCSKARDYSNRTGPCLLYTSPSPRDS